LGSTNSTLRDASVPPAQDGGQSRVAPRTLPDAQGRAAPRLSYSELEPPEAPLAEDGHVPRAATRREELDLEGRIAQVLRTRRALTFGICVWTAFGLVDWLVVVEFQIPTLAWFVTLRAAGELILLATLLRLFRKPIPSRRALLLLDVLPYATCSAFIAVMCVRFWGIASPYGPGICLVMVHRSITAGDPWKRGLVMNGAQALSYPVVLLIAAAIDPTIARQFHDPRALSLFGIYAAFVFGTMALIVVGGHVVWALRQQVFEARSIGRYKLKKRIGSGGMGDVWLAHHAALRRDVALKILRSDGQTGPGAVSRFEREVRATTELAHPNTVRVFDYGVTEDGLRYYAMELLTGETLASLVTREGPLPPGRAIHLANQAARALGEAHAHGIVHRDIKPENLFVTTLGGESDFVKVLDFGVARFFRSAADATVTSTGWLVGTPAYMSPEAALGKATDARADVYSLGAALYFMLAGKPPFDQSNAGSVVIAHVHERPQPPSIKRGAPLPVDLEAVVMRCLEKDPAARYATGAEVATALTQCADAAAVHIVRPASSSRPPASVIDPGAATIASSPAAIRYDERPARKSER
jgi:serine/threonine-protein kinase